MAVRTFPNKYAARCQTCGAQVDIAEGLTRKGDEAKGEGKWVTIHNECPSQATATPVKTKFAPTDEQAHIVKLFATGENLVIQAAAGAGKTSTMKLLSGWAQVNNKRGRYLVYNRQAADDVRPDMPDNVVVSTTHSIARQAVGHAFAARLEMKRQFPSEIATILAVRPMTLPSGRHLAAGWLAAKAVGMVKRFSLSGDAELSVKHLEYVEGIDEPSPMGERTYTNNKNLAAYLLPIARRAWADVTDADNGRLKVEHDHYLKLWSLNSPDIDVDFILLDEAQDTTPVTMSIVEHNAARGVQIVAVGDEQQVLYEWRGAIDAMIVFERSGAKVAFLSQSFRFGAAVADVANVILERLDARLRVKGFAPVTSTIGAVERPDAILCRTNAGAVRALMGSLEAGRRVHLAGGTGEILSFCKAAEALQAGRRTDHADLGMFGTWAEVVEYSKEEHGQDLALMVKLVESFGPAEIIAALKGAASDKVAKAPGWDGVTISTAHKSKGLQFPSVQIAGDFIAPKEGASMQAAELRLAYVAVTRAQHALDMTLVPHFLASGAAMD